MLRVVKIRGGGRGGLEKRGEGMAKVASGMRYGEIIGGGGWKKLVGVRRKEVGVWRDFAPTHTHVQDAKPKSTRPPASHDPVHRSTRGDQG